jgi:GLPGLI family protein
MKQFLLIVLMAGLFFHTASAQAKTGYFVSYHVKVKLALSDSLKNKKVDVKLNLGEDSSASDNVMEFLLGDFLTKPIDVDLSLYIIANADSSKLIFDADDSRNEGNDGIRINLNTPDTIFYKKDQWRKTGNNDEPISTITLNVTETKEKKNILGYECIKFVSLDSTRKENVIIWASKKLPNTLVPFIGLKGFKYGILEVNNIETNSHTIATKVEEF